MNFGFDKQQEESAKLPTIVTMQGRGTLLGNNGDPRNSKSSKNLTLATRKSIYITDFIAESESRKRENRSLRRISILPIHATDDENNGMDRDLFDCFVYYFYDHVV